MKNSNRVNDNSNKSNNIILGTIFLTGLKSLFSIVNKKETPNYSKYTNKEIDFFMTEQDGIFYLYPAPEEGLKEKTLRVCPTKSGQTKGISFAKDYIFEEVIKNY